MAENTYPVKPVGIEYICDICKVGRMQYQRLVFSGHMEHRETTFEHKCNHVDCGHVQEFPIQYPTVRFVSI